MSLINDALKRAQNQRGPSGSGHSTPPNTPAGASSGAGARSGQKIPAWIMVGGGLVGGLALAAIVFVAARPSAPAPAPQTENSVPTAVAASTPKSLASSEDKNAEVLPIVKTEAPVATPSAPQNVPPATTPVQTSPSVASASPNASKSETPPASPSPRTEAAPTVSTPAASTTPPRPTTRMINAIEALRVAGIRPSGNDSKVIMNDRVFRIGDIVDHELGIRLVGATANSLTFTDETGASYTRNFY